MKWLAIALLIANVIVFGWRFNEQIRTYALATAGTPPLPRGAPSLRLVSELPSLPERRAGEEPEGAGEIMADEAGVIQSVDLSTEINSDATASNTCVEIGPIEEKKSVDNLRTWLRDRTADIHTRTETVRERRYFWVYLEPASDEEAKQKLNELAQRGVTDYMLIRRGGLKNAISLGLFRSQDSVNRRLAEMTEQGYTPVVVPKFESTENFWLRATMAEGHEDTSKFPQNLLGQAFLDVSPCRDVTATETEPAP